MTNNELVKLVNECLELNPSERDINFYLISDPNHPEVCLDNPLSVLKLRAAKINGLCLPINRVWHAYYSLSEPKNNKSIGNCIEIPLKILDRFRSSENPKDSKRPQDPEYLTLLVHYKNRNKLDVYVSESYYDEEIF